MADEKNPLGRGIGFPQKYNQDPGPTQELNPDAVVEPNVARAPRTVAAQTPKAKTKK